MTARSPKTWPSPKAASAAQITAEDVTADRLPVCAFSVGEEELSGLDTGNLVGHLATWNYFESADTPENKAFVTQWHAFIKYEKRTPNDPMEAHCIGFTIWVNAMTAAGITDVDAVSDAMIGQKFPNLTGTMAEMLPDDHLTRPVLIALPLAFAVTFGPGGRWSGW